MSTTIWVVIGLCAVATAAIKAVGPMVLGGRPLPAPATGVIVRLAPALLAALVVTGVFSQEGHLHASASVVGVAAGGALAVRGSSILICVLVAAALTAALRAVA